MTDSHIEGRLSFPNGQQRKFVEDIQVKLGASISELAKIVEVHPRTLRDWRREKFLISTIAANILSNHAGILIPRAARQQDRFWYASKAGKVGGKALIKKYGRVSRNEGTRKRKWREWWEAGGKLTATKFLQQPLPFRKPPPSQDLAEFFGIMMGDGGSTDYQMVITLHHTDDLDYSFFVKRLIKKLFGVSAKTNHRPAISVNNIAISRRGLITYLKTLELVTGNKVRQQFDVPSWIKNNDAFLKACVRGLVDTDGCIFLHRYKVNKKEYAYKKLCFTSMSRPLRETVFCAFERWGFTPSMNQNRDVRLNSIRDLKSYFNLIGSHNPKHLNKYQK